MKRGISPLVATVIIIGFTIVIATVVFRWSSGFFESNTEEQSEEIQVATTCVGDVNPKVKQACILGDKIRFLIENNGVQDITGFVFKIEGEDVNINSTYGVDSFRSKNLYASYNGMPDKIKTIKIYPKIMINNKEATCDYFIYKMDPLVLCDGPNDPDNLISNGDFEDFTGSPDDDETDSINEWSKTCGEPTTIISDSYFGMYSVKTSGDGGCLFQQIFNVDSGTYYKLFLYSKYKLGIQGSISIRCPPSTDPGDPKDLEFIFISTSPEWERFEGTFTPGMETSCAIQLYDPCCGTMGERAFDGIQVIKPS